MAATMTTSDRLRAVCTTVANARGVVYCQNAVRSSRWWVPPPDAPWSTSAVSREPTLRRSDLAQTTLTTSATAYGADQANTSAVGPQLAAATTITARGCADNRPRF